jgi:nitric oxide reductase NorD protein
MQGGAGSSEESAGAPAPDDEVSFPKDDLPALPKGPAPGGILYPEWIDRFKRLEPRHTTVFDVAAPEGDGTWARDALRDHARLIRQLRDRFSMLRARRLRLRGQRSGEEIDLDAVVKAVVDMKLNRVPTDRLYQTTRSSRHPLAITILVDVSGSTNELLPNGQSVLDVERLSVVLASEALSSLGDPYSILAFSGNSRHSVRVATIKSFGERELGPMHRRVSILESGDNTRLGAAVRHATSLLLRQSAHRHVLLILSDGKPHDVDWYWADAAIEDSRIALREARAAGVHSFCITVDATEADYLPHLFGEGRYWVLANPTELPKALIRLIDTILTA